MYGHSGGRRAWCDMRGLAPTRAHPRADLEMTNAGVSNHATVNALARIERDVIAKIPHLVVVTFGMNDVKDMALEEYRRNLQTINRRCLDTGAAVVLCTPSKVYKNKRWPNE